MRKLLTALILGAALMAFFGNALAEEKAYVPKDNEELYGTWVNMDYKTADPPQKLTYKSDGTIYSSIYAESRMLLWKTKFQITAKWKDSEGNIWYKGHWVVVDTGQEGYSLYKISNSGKTCEYIFAHNECPTKVDTEHRNYRIYYHKAEEMAKEGTISVTLSYNSPYKAMPMGKDLQLIFDAIGVAVADSEASPFHDSSVRLVGSGLVLKGAYTEVGSTVLNLSDGSKIFMTFEGKAVGPGKLEGSWTFIGGTENFAGITGGGQMKRLNVPKPAMESSAQGYIKVTGNWKLP